MRPGRTARLGIGAVIAAAALTGVLVGPAGAAEVSHGPGVRQVELTIPTSDGRTLPATLRLPDGAAPGGPAMVLVHGAGVGPRAKYAAEAEAFARAGVATLAYDKRGSGYSLTERSYSRLADDAVSALDVLRHQPGIDPARVGLWGISEGGWVAPLAASRAPEAAFLVVVGANGVAPLRQQTWADAVKVQSAGVRGSLVDAASSGVYRLISDMGMFPEPYYDPAPVLRGLRLPVLGVWGALDRATPPVESVAAFRDDLDEAGNRHYTLRTFDSADHTLRTTVDGFEQGPDFAPGYPELVGSWTSAAVRGQAPASSVTGNGQQPRPTADVPPLAWYQSAPAHGVALALMLGGFGGFGIAAAVRRLARLVRTRRAGARTATADRTDRPALVPAGTTDAAAPLLPTAPQRTRSRTSAAPSPARPLPDSDPPGAESSKATFLAGADLKGAFRNSGTEGDNSGAGGDRRSGSEVAPVSARVLASTGLVTVVGTLTYLVTLTLVRGGRTVDPGPLLLDRPLPWLALQALAVTAVVAGIALAVRLVRGGVRRSGGERVRLTMLLVAGAVLVPWAFYWGLLLP